MYAHVPNGDSGATRRREWFLVRRRPKPVAYVAVGRGARMPQDPDQLRDNEGGGDEPNDQEMRDEDIL